MKILIAHYYLNNLGGIINNNEALTAGLEALGHKVTNRLLVWKPDVGRDVNRSRRLEAEVGAMGLSHDQELGWKWTATHKIPYQGKKNIAAWYDYANRFDLLIWQIPVPTMQKSNRGNTDWLELYDLEVPQVAYIHDGNLPDSYPWIWEIHDKLVGCIGVHPCAYHSLQYLPVLRAMAFSPQMNIEERVKAADKVKKRSGWFSLQTFKAWKHVEDLIRAVPHMTNDEDKRLAGGGLMYYYMTSPDKIKTTFLADYKYDPDMRYKWKGQRIWELASSHGMQYLDYLTTAQRDKEMVKARMLIDPSWSLKYANIGDHFNRTLVEGIIAGCIPVARNLGVATNRNGKGEFFIPDKNYLMIPYDVPPKVFAEYVDSYLMREDAQDIVREARKLLPLFDYKFTAQAFIDIAFGRPAGVYKKKNDVGKPILDLRAESKRAVDEFFSAEAEDEDDRPPF
jgi:glycosyltransferase involved in cell wall biosynthesis